MPLQDLAVEHRMYAPLAFVIAAVVLASFAIGPKLFGNNTVAVTSTVCIGLSGVLAMMTITRNEDYKSAIRMWEDVVAKRASDGAENMLAGRAYSNLGEAYGDSQQWRKSIESLERALKSHQFLPNVYGNLARAYIATGDADRAKGYCATALQLSPDSARLNQQAGLIDVMQKNFEAAYKHFRRAYELAPNDSVIILNLAQCRQHLATERRRRRCYAKAIAMDSKIAEPRARLVELLKQHGQLDEAIIAANQFGEAIPQDARASLQLGTLWGMKGDLAKAKEHLEVAAASDSPPAEANFLLGNLQRNANELAAARRSYEREIKYFPENADALSRLGELTAKDNPQLAIAYFQRVVNLAPRAWQARYNMASLHAMMGNRSLAMEQLKKVLELKPDCEPAKKMCSRWNSPPRIGRDADISIRQIFIEASLKLHAVLSERMG